LKFFERKGNSFDHSPIIPEKLPSEITGNAGRKRNASREKDSRGREGWGNYNEI